MKISNNIKFFISTILIIIAFFLGYLLNYFQSNQKIENLENSEHFVKIEELKTKYKLNTSDDKTYIYYNDEKISSLDIEK